MASIGRIPSHYFNVQQTNRFLCPTISNFGSADLKLVLLHEWIFMFYYFVCFLLCCFFLYYIIGIQLVHFSYGLLKFFFYLSTLLEFVLSFLDCQVIWLLISEGLLLLSKVFQSQNVFKVCYQVRLPTG